MRCRDRPSPCANAKLAEERLHAWCRAVVSHLPFVLRQLRDALEGLAPAVRVEVSRHTVPRGFHARRVCADVARLLATHGLDRLLPLDDRAAAMVPSLPP